MIVTCSDCDKRFDDEFRNTICPHETFLASDGRNNFRHYPESFLESDNEKAQKPDRKRLAPRGTL